MMFTHIRTSKENREIVSKLTRQLNLGAENAIARIALSYSLKQERRLDLKDIQNSSGKEYSKSVLFGKNSDYYSALVALHYGLYISDKDIPKYIKLHIDDGLEILYKELSIRRNIDGFDFLVEKMEEGVKELV
ncbi:DndE family protein [Salegentibacter sp. F188]|uniref:DndE family protein n=1 Tax=Autumnicola patrickiae TaxID=3075591 RepID=A0ABU3DYD9_9FLAO|nr:DndE family protein [Salegentibacter sp. F188]MDT0688745.1 DndE family protein [Salegentibacter sp. F188]